MQKVTVKHKEYGNFYLTGVTEIHWNHKPSIRPSVAFESDVIGTGWNYPIADIEEFEAKDEFPISDETIDLCADIFRFPKLTSEQKQRVAVMFNYAEPNLRACIREVLGVTG